MDVSPEQHRIDHPERYDADGHMVTDFNFVPSDRAEVVQVDDGKAFLRFREAATGKLNERMTIGDNDPWPVGEVSSWAETWNEAGVARWPARWILNREGSSARTGG